MQKLTIAALTGSALLTGVVAASAADMAVKASPVVVPAFSWTGFYIGGNLGGAWSGNGSDAYTGPVFPGFFVLPPVAAVLTLVPGQIGTLAGTGNKSGFIGGVQAGYNWQVNQAVFGVEADVMGTSINGSSASASRTFGAPVFVPAVTQTVTVDYGRINWMASFRGRLGFAADRALFYVTGGAAVADFGGAKVTVVNGPGIGGPGLPTGTFSSTGSGSDTRWGWTLGGGIEWAFSQNWSVAGEYRHTDFGRRGATVNIPDGFGGTFATAATSTRATVDQATLRVNYRFGGPVVARY